jgi:hypothetical protein
VDVLDAVPKDVFEPNQDGEPDAAQLQVVGQLLEVDRLGGILRRVDQDVPGR